MAPDTSLERPYFKELDVGLLYHEATPEAVLLGVIYEDGALRSAKDSDTAAETAYRCQRGLA